MSGYTYAGGRFRILAIVDKFTRQDSCESARVMGSGLAQIATD
jgi:hypothetical protein